jgi:MFS-type transporter involved in bile tolerance (Atg22 family)
LNFVYGARTIFGLEHRSDSNQSVRSIASSTQVFRFALLFSMFLTQLLAQVRSFLLSLPPA